MKYYLVSLLLILILVSGCVRQGTTPLIDKRDSDTGVEEEEEPEEETLGLSTQEDLFEAIRNAVDEHLKE